jgi:hypothetical protein
VIDPLPTEVNEQLGVNNVLKLGAVDEIVQEPSEVLKPPPVTVTKKFGPAVVGETETVGTVTVKGGVPETTAC